MCVYVYVYIYVYVYVCVYVGVGVCVRCLGGVVCKCSRSDVSAYGDAVTIIDCLLDGG